jgi:hypothetical protein
MTIGNRGKPTDDVGSIIIHHASNFTRVVTVDDPSFRGIVHGLFNTVSEFLSWRFPPTRIPVQTIKGYERNTKLFR